MKQFVLGPYKGLNLKSFDTSVKESEVKEAIDYLLNAMEDVQTEKKEGVETGDHIIATLEGIEKKTGIPLIREETHQFRVGDKVEIFPEEFVELLIGKKTGDIIRFDMTVDSIMLINYHNLSGRELTFTIKIKKVFITGKPDLTDDTVMEIDPRLRTVEDLKLKLEEEIAQEKEAQKREANINIVFRAVIDQCQYEFDEESLEQAAQDLYKEFAVGLADEDNDMKVLVEYLTQRQISANTLLEECREEVAKHMIRDQILDDVITAENITITPQEQEALEKKFNEDQDKGQLPKDFSDIKVVEAYFLRRKALEFLLDANLAD